MTYAKNTDVPIDRTQMEIQQFLQKQGAHKFLIDWENGTIGFDLMNRVIRITLHKPSFDAFEKTSSGRQRDTERQQSAYDQAIRQRWRALFLIIKAKIEAISSGISTIDEEFLSYFLVSQNKTVGDLIIPQLKRSVVPSLPEYHSN